MLTPKGTFTADQLADEVARCVNGRGVVLARGSRGVYDSGVKYGVHAHHLVGDELVEVLSASVVESDWARSVELCRARFRALVGRRSFVDGKPIVWTEGTPRFSAWFGGALIVSLESDGLRCGGDQVVARENISSVELYAGDDWVARGVRLVLSDGQTLVLVGVEDKGPEVDFTYGVEDLERETAWAAYLGKSLAASLAIPYADVIDWDAG